MSHSENPWIGEAPEIFVDCFFEIDNKKVHDATYSSTDIQDVIFSYQEQITEFCKINKIKYSKMTSEFIGPNELRFAIRNEFGISIGLGLIKQTN